MIHLDSFYWKPGWQATPREEWEEIVTKLAEQDEWIIDGNYSQTLDVRLDKSDTVIFFDFPRSLCLYRVVKRRIQYHGKTRADMAEGCSEKIDWEFLQWIWNFRKKKRPAILQKLKAVQDGKTVVIFRHPQEAEQYQKGIRDNFY
ncbi:AAA family ATPase [Brevibacillus humidisoli]|uniref:AAA family ATPase n=1 Tax=Brevibacillus humidisoli TaxID=2895522 RepID=UPI001E49EE5B|nr:AAA family ATPase [Brevibacillus humidisoli]